MSTVARVALLLGQALGVAAVLLGVLLLWGPGWAVLVGGVLLLVGSTALEASALGRPGGRSSGRRAPTDEGAT